MQETKYVALLRGINTGGHKQILMKDLQVLFNEMGFKNVETYIQSGNVIFNSSIKNRNEIIKKIESDIENKYGFQVNVILRSKEDLAQIINDIAEFHLDGNDEKIYIACLSDNPQNNYKEKMKPNQWNQVQAKIYGKQLLICVLENKISDTQFTNNVIEKTLGVSSTMRNLNSIRKIYGIMVK